MSDQDQALTNYGDHLGVSVVICTHNGAKLLPTTLAHLNKQQVPNGVRWEVLVIDNASTDDTASVARQCWGDNGPAPLRLICEPRLGLSYAREHAFQEARYEIISFVDDDNWVAPDWVAIASRCMSCDLQLGALGSANKAVADAPLPEWFQGQAIFFGAMENPEFAANATWLLIGAGMTIRKNVWHWLKANGFRSHLSDRVGTSLSSSGDIEIGCAIRLAGWKIRIEPRLQLQHYMTPNRLQWRYLRRLAKSIGESNPIIDAYLADQSEPANLINRLRLRWWAHFAKESISLVCSLSPLKVIKSRFHEMEGDDQVAKIELRLGRLIGLLRLRSKYDQIRFDVAHARWRRVDSVNASPLTLDRLEGPVLVQ
jgi:glycosyltransferase involved in cell wall biosynthesis